MVIETKYQPGDIVEVRHPETDYSYCMTIKGIVVYGFDYVGEEPICYFEGYEEDNIPESHIVKKLND